MPYNPVTLCRYLRTRSAFIANLSDVIKMEVLKAIITTISKTYILVITTSTLATMLSLTIKRERLFIAISYIR
jgi:hypothetical protein